MRYVASRRTGDSIQGLQRVKVHHALGVWRTARAVTILTILTSVAWVQQMHRTLHHDRHRTARICSRDWYSLLVATRVLVITCKPIRSTWGTGITAFWFTQAGATTAAVNASPSFYRQSFLSLSQRPEGRSAYWKTQATRCWFFSLPKVIRSEFQTARGWFFDHSFCSFIEIERFTFTIGNSTSSFLRSFTN